VIFTIRVSLINNDSDPIYCASLAMPEMLVEIEVEAIIETNRLRLPKGAVSR
jgi:hypothetical protein